MESNLHLGPVRRRGHRDPIRLMDYCDQYGKPCVGMACDASCVGFRDTIKNDGYFHGRVEWQCIDLATGEKVFESDVQPESTINIGEFMAIVTSLKILHGRGDSTSPVWSDSKLCIQWVVGRYTSSNLPMNEFTWEALDGMAEYLEWLKKEKPVNPILWWNKHKFGDHPADYGRKGAPAKAAPERANFARKKEKDPYTERAKTLVDTFSKKDGTGSVLITCAKRECAWPRCLCVTK